MHPSVHVAVCGRTRYDKNDYAFAHPREDSVSKLSGAVGADWKVRWRVRWVGRESAVHLSLPERSAKSFVPGALQCAEVVELADTPS